MEGIYIRRKMSIWLILLLLCGIFFIALYIFLNIVDPEATGELLTFLIIGILLSLVSVFSMLLNPGVSVCIEENTIKAREYGLGRLDCRFEDVAFVLPQINSLTVLLKSGRRYVIMGLENSWELGSAIRRQIFEMETETPDSIRQQLTRAQAAWKRSLWWVLGGCGMLFVNIFLAVLLTGGREMYDFGERDWILFGIMCAAELFTFLGLFCAAGRCAKQQLPIEQLNYRLRGAILGAHPLPAGQVQAVYTDEHYSGRIVVCGFPNDSSVYYCVQEFTGGLELETVYTSEIYESADQLPQGGFSVLMDITSHIVSP